VNPIQTTRISAYAIIRDEDRILLCRISSFIEEWAGYWTLPGGGIDFGEHPADAAIREVKEETGLEVALVALAEIDSQMFDHGERQSHAIRFIFEAEILGGEVRSELEGSTDMCAWFTRGETMDMPLVELAQTGINLAFEE
jgi:ADP-ribose pyrophosphatase YjhB (NUDIX family)